MRALIVGLLAVLPLYPAAPGPAYDRTTEVDVTAIVTAVKETPKENALSGLYLVVRTESDSTMGIYLGPVDFLKSFEIPLTKGDRVRVIGSKVKFGGEVVLLAREVRKEAATIYLRDKNGQPYWPAEAKP
jgi:hypothetical protein